MTRGYKRSTTRRSRTVLWSERGREGKELTLPDDAPDPEKHGRRQLQLRHRVQEPVRAPGLPLTREYQRGEPGEHVRRDYEGRHREEQRRLGRTGSVAEHHRHNIEEGGEPGRSEAREDALRRETGGRRGDERGPLRALSTKG